MKIARLDKQFNFIREIDREKDIARQTPTLSGRAENDAEHAWHMAVMALILAEYAAEPVDLLRTIEMILIHDLVEIYAGDTYAYDTEGQQDRRKREEAAAERIYSLLPDDQRVRLLSLWEEFERGKSTEACFARTIDNLQPMMLNAASGGIPWKKHKVRLSQILDRNSSTALGSEALWDYAKKKFLEPAVRDGTIFS